VPARAVALTFDDGYRDNLELVAPILERLQLPATFFLVPGILSAEVVPYWEVVAWAFAGSTRTTVRWRGRVLPIKGWRGRRAVAQITSSLRQLNREARDETAGELLRLLAPDGRLDGRSLFLDWRGAQELVTRGFSVGSHSMHHVNLRTETADAQFRDLDESRRRLEAELGIDIPLLAYPNGGLADYDTRTLDAAERAGYAYGLTARTGLNSPSTPPFEIRRVMLEPHRGFSHNIARRIVGRIMW
jgi:peptidoglycan/xylan/chitin deacetylase (PgdA/CDA1 family)